MKTAMVRKTVFVVLIAFTIVNVFGCGGVTKQIVRTKEKDKFVRVIINDKNIKSEKYGPKLVGKIKAAFRKSFENVSVRTGYDNPKNGEILITPNSINSGSLYAETIKEAERKRRDIPHGGAMMMKLKATTVVSTINNDDVYILQNEGIFFHSTPHFIVSNILGIATCTVSMIIEFFIYENIAKNRAIESTAIDLHNKVVTSSKFRAYAESARMLQTSAADLKITPTFADFDALLPNNTIDAAEQSTIIATITNSGKGTAFDVMLNTESNYKNIEFPETIPVGDIQPGESKDIKINIKADLDLNTGTVPFLISCTEKRGYDARKINLKVPAVRLERPEIVVASYRINDGSTGLARGNGNGIPENGETIEITAFVKNEGAGDALNVTLVLDTAFGIEVVQRESLVGTISPGQSAKAKLAFHIPRTFSGNDLFFKLAASEVRLGHSAVKEVAFHYESNMPMLAFASRILRGGEEVERVANGESFELEITPKNHGSLSAKNIRLRVNSPDLNYSSATVNIGDLKPGTSGSPQWFDFHIPRAFANSKLIVEFSLDQSDFAEKTDTIEIPVAVIAPKLAYTAVVSGRYGGNTIEQGERAYLEMQVQNTGGLEARDVKLKLNIANSKVKIMDENVRVLPRIPAGSFSETVKFDLLVLRKVQPGELPVRISLTQADFPDVDFEHKLMVKAEDAEMMEVVAATGYKARHFTSSGSIGPVLAIARPQNGLRVYDESLYISGTVVDARGIDRIEVKINGIQKPVTIASASTMNKKEFSASLHLQNGENRIVVAAYNNNDVRSEEVRIVYKATAVGGKSHIPPLSLFCDVDKKALELPAVGQNADHKKWAILHGSFVFRLKTVLLFLMNRQH
ncbi:MAG: hypothetical protein JRD93_18725 [Deltaproteobacteria bacterium]|nr:hypothetical protein [Deltaproteobacteria bacterium]